ncbi:type I polyketide synthase [Streptomyces sp. HPF1205]|uniref:type I polyketide synthase n=1 Tax=Streptomyces sp. HPF1205 TaxID=2873262 RepID=UPI001CECE3CA|nr:type I polyketide synthase [Streptomyces sp. HPF1205]
MSAPAGERIAVVGLACRYPDADSPQELWRNVLAGRRAFRRLPDERLRREDYWSADPSATDRTYAAKAAVLEGFEFDRVAYRVAGSTFRATDMTHWLALDTAARALEDAGFPAGRGLPATSTGVIVGNTLTGEFTRAGTMRLRWPYVRRTVGAALRGHGWDDTRLGLFLDELEERYKAPFPPMDEDSLAGGLSNTIAGRICNHFDLQGGGFTVDGACSSSLLSVATACDALADGRMDVAVAGGVDLSLDPFELVGFARTGALATGEMRVYDRDSSGFWPGEGCGMVVLMRTPDAVRQGRTVHAEIAGWGYSSDGAGSITRPRASGHRLALLRAYARAGFGPDSVGYFEGHGTGTAVGDATELRVIADIRHEFDPDAAPAAISTVKGNLGHTKAAAGVAGLIKAVLAVRHQVIPPATGHARPHPELTAAHPALRVPDRPELWPERLPVRAGVSALGFGGINAHVVLQGADGNPRRTTLGPTTRGLAASRQDVELLLLDADSPAQLRARAADLAALSARLCEAEVADLAAALERELAGRPVRAAVLAASPEQSEQRLNRLAALLDSGTRSALDGAGGVFLGGNGRAPRIGLLFPGQGTGHSDGGGALRRRFPQVADVYRDLAPATGTDPVATSRAQPRIVADSAAGLRMLAAFGIEASVAAGHSLGEITALHWAGAMDEAALLRIATERGRIMERGGAGNGTMASIGAAPQDVEPLLHGEPVVVAGYNSPRQTVVSGPVDAVRRVRAAAAARGLDAAPLRVSHAFHSPAVAPAAAAFADRLATERFAPLARPMVSSVTGGTLPARTDVPGLLSRQMLAPVRFTEAVRTMAADTDLFVETGPGRVLSGLAADIAPSVPAVSMETGSPSLAGLFRTLAAAYVLGAPLRHAELFRGRFTRPLPLDKEFRFLANPCESVPGGLPATGTQGPAAHSPATGAAPAATPAPDGARQGTPAPGTGDTRRDAVPAGAPGDPARPDQDGGTRTAPAEQDSLSVLLRLAADHAELPHSAIAPDARPLDDLHLSSITVGRIVNEACAELDLGVPEVTTAFATATLAELAELLDDLAAAPQQAAPPVPPGVAPWVRAFTVDLVPAAPGPPVHPCAPGEWRLFTEEPHPLAAPLAEALRAARLGDGVLLCLPAECDESHVPLMLAAARAALEHPGSDGGPPVRFVAVGGRRGAAGLARTLRLEAPHLATTVITLPLPRELPPARARELTARLVADVAATETFSEVRYGGDGTRLTPVLKPLPPAAGSTGGSGGASTGGSGSATGDATGAVPSGASGGGSALPLGRDDVVLVTGGGKGITAECALMLGTETGAALALIGRSDPARDPELAANLERMAAAGLAFGYFRADLTAPEQVKAAVGEAETALGPVTAVLHGAGRNVPQPLTRLDESSFRHTLATKVTGLETVLAATDASALRLLVTFGSIIGRAGLPGEADYATANDWLTDLTERVGEEYGCRCLALEWSVWSGSGMGERLGVVESLVREGIDPIPTDEGVAMLRHLLAEPATPAAVVVAGRTGALPTLTFDGPEPPLLRFTDRIAVHYPGVELVAESVLSVTGDPYLADHRLDGDLLFPAVMGMEAMSQAAAALTGRDEAPALEELEFLRPIVVPEDGRTTIRVAALVTAPGTVRLVVRSSETGFLADHFRATARYGLAPPDGGPPRPVAADMPHRGGADTPHPVAVGEPHTAAAGAPRLPLDPATELYGTLLFQGTRFQRLLGYRALSARSCVAELSGTAGRPWFAGYLPAGLVLSDPGAHDAMMHAVQVCVPDATLLPVSLERLHTAGRTRPAAGGPLTVHAAERSRSGDSYVYDLDIRDATGTLVERWTGLCLRAVRKSDGRGPWPPALLGAYLERHAEPALGAQVRCVVLPDEGGAPRGTRARRERTAAAVAWAANRPVTVRYRPDGRPEPADGRRMSASHGAGVTLAVLGEPAVPAQVACDVEPVLPRTDQEWRGLLGADGPALVRAVAAALAEDPDVAATRVWSAIECVRKLGRVRVDLTLADGTGAADGRWAVFRSGGARIATFATTLSGADGPVVFALTRETTETTQTTQTTEGAQ